MTQDLERQQHILGGHSTGQWPTERRNICCRPYQCTTAEISWKALLQARGHKQFCKRRVTDPLCSRVCQLKGVPVQLVQQCRDTSCPVPIIFGSAGCSSLDHLFFVGLFLCVGVPNSYSNLTYPLGIGPLGCEYSTLLYSLSSFYVCSLSGLRQFSPSNTRSCPLYRSIPFGIPRILGRTYPVQADWNRIE